MLIACVKQGDKYGPEYVRRLQAGVWKHLPPGSKAEFVCLTDKHVPGVLCQTLKEGLPGWWSKLELFKQDEPLIYFDLDVVITGDLGPLLNWEGSGFLKDWWLPGFNSSVMKLTGNEGHVWNNFTPDVMRTHYMGDQHWITRQIPKGRTFPAHWFPSYKANNCQDAPPADAMAVIMHGDPKPHHITTGWVPKLWSPDECPRGQRRTLDPSEFDKLVSQTALF
jgi:hypothetical protein